MDDIFDDRSELAGTLLTLEFGQGGRIMQLWGADPTMPEESDEFQFILGPVSFGEEFSEDYYPGTILLGARTTPEEPWIVSRSSNTNPNPESDESGEVKFEYDFPLLPEIRATGHYYEVGSPIPQVCWDVEIINRGRVAIEIGELAFPFAFYNLMQGASKDEKTGRNPYQDRVYIHTFVGGTASYLHAQRMSNEAPGLLVFPGENTSWEMFTHVPRSLSSPYHWEGIPVVYLHSRASVEREEWPSHFFEHSSLILEPGDSKKFQTRFVTTSPTVGDSVFQTLSACKRPSMRLLPGAVAPTNVGIAVEIAGVVPKRFAASTDAELETDTDETGGFCFVRPKKPGPVRLRFDHDRMGRSFANLLFIEPIETLISKRAQWICDHQFHEDKDSVLHHAILATNIRTQERISAAEDYAFPFALESGLSDLLFLAEKNAIDPVLEQIQLLDTVIADFLRDDVQNPADGSIGCVFADLHSVALNYGRPRIYPIVINIYMAMHRISKYYGLGEKPAESYLHEAARTAYSLFQILRRPIAGGLPSYSRIDDLIRTLFEESYEELATELQTLAHAYAREVVRQPVTDVEDLSGDSGRFEELFWAATWLQDEGLVDIALRHAFAARDLGPCWWSYGSDYHIVHETEGVPHDAIVDKGQLLLGHSTVANSLMVMELLRSDSRKVEETWIRAAFGGMLGVWGLIRADGAASMGFCPDAASGHFGFNPLTGDIGLSLFHYLRGVRSIVIPSRQFGVTTFGCHFEANENEYIVQPWDGVQQRVSMRQIGFDCTIEVGKIKELRLDIRKRSASIEIANSTDFDTKGIMIVRGLWGYRIVSGDDIFEASGGVVKVPFELKKKVNTLIRLEVEK
jgi:hypothetical protein